MANRHFVKNIEKVEKSPSVEPWQLGVTIQSSSVGVYKLVGYIGILNPSQIVNSHHCMVILLYGVTGVNSEYSSN